VKGRLNLFQAAMLRWRDLHPYSAVHAIRIDLPLDAARVTSVIDRQLETLGLTGLTLDVARERFEYAGGAAKSMLAVYAAGDEPLQVLQREIERELNAAYPREGPFVPFRFFAVDSGAHFYLALAYDHFVAAGDSIVVLMKDLYAGYSGTESARSQSLVRYPATCRRLFRRHPGSALRGIRRLREMAESCRRSVRPRYPGGPDAHNAFAYCRIEPGPFAAMLRTAKAWGVTVNDLLIAMLLRGLDPIAGERPERERRHELAVGSIVNLRRDFGYDANTTFGQFLSNFRVSHPVPSGISLERLTRDIHAETARIKSEKLYLQNLVAIGIIGKVWRFLSLPQRQGFYAKNYPAWGAITMINVDAIWADAGGSMPPPEYLRAVSTGPLAPLVVAVTTSAGVLHAGISYRTAAFTASEVDRIAAGIVECARKLDG
jgi:hypothetical protein